MFKMILRCVKYYKNIKNIKNINLNQKFVPLIELIFSILSNFKIIGNLNPNIFIIKTSKYQKY